MSTNVSICIYIINVYLRLSDRKSQTAPGYHALGQFSIETKKVMTLLSCRKTLPPVLQSRQPPASQAPQLLWIDVSALYRLVF